ncbi:11-beta-hydroxysteroid dehydrogenase-like 4A [Tetranychus urticae]|uniref:11-beta-hydroxysteroid dehydrogenase-like 4A n=1 Tax=Tetranychus urticae TaxID=32264 RepID=UPI00077BCF9A|nr:11-beta-hydroxysteroid dehydrogenase-like 4A [Tetranychus urticae]
MINLNNKVALITGSSDGIGKTTAILFSSLGAKVAIVGRDQSKLDKVAAECEAKSPHGYRPVVIRADFLHDEDIKRTFEETIAGYCRLDILVNNVGVVNLKSFDDPEAIADYDRVMQTNIRTAVILTHLAKPYLIESKGSIVNVSSVDGLKPISSEWSYCMSKAAVNAFTQAIASVTKNWF